MTNNYRDAIQNMNLFVMNDSQLYFDLWGYAELEAKTNRKIPEDTKLWFCGLCLERFYQLNDDIDLSAFAWMRIIPKNELLQIWNSIEEDYNEMVKERGE